MAKALGKHPQLIAWQIDNGLGGNFTEASFNEDTRRDWHAWLEAKYETIERLNELMGLRHWGQMVTSWDQVPMPMHAPTLAQPGAGAGLDAGSAATPSWQFVKMQADLLHELTPNCPGHHQSARAASAASTILTWPRRLISSPSKATPPSRPSPPNWPAKLTCCAR